VGRGVGGEFLQSGELGNVTGTSREPPDNCRFWESPKSLESKVTRAS
jgi:hypothetical protein